MVDSGFVHYPPPQPQPYAYQWPPPRQPPIFVKSARGADTSLAFRIILSLGAVVLLTGIIASIAIPSFLASRTNLRQQAAQSQFRSVPGPQERERLPADGASSLPGESASVTYGEGRGQFELAQDADMGAGPHDGAKWAVSWPAQQGRSKIGLEHVVYEPVPAFPSQHQVDWFVRGKQRQLEEAAGHRVRHAKRRIDGRDAYVWKYSTPDGRWFFDLWIPNKVHTIRYFCEAQASQVRVMRKRCAASLKTIEFARGLR